ncbi:ubiquinone biosynthesis O-methyltransferase [Procambarus clarkii]|uniref:ubiquinone biosynthesis O-methyltransferase n=1 Tax=Procambarus clarkii TaxID=6728 RepID=UPI001E673ADC|nr:ubiquinone biosynthesis O-methyltransferase, mitochondrial-like [Procambarus clarkii]XP_045606630.1 ubiquinone biosynthesis O-methyltransferase, mitochondrial-like [Procambarus clarkii]XP_045606631.1 ubiquinone biosynthesis O-methyltransferase, mitochondrial-like [Procambarus clarkii]XP_045606632.1 ubiquinone biosynthesis O-methyltransferase, mitochondrial-like [Procambarus clarkii]XP_045606633.1 ubiquinone biosynthesis O-methyltransferase, mitochondrial-like [Procambarus clarkii]
MRTLQHLLASRAGIHALKPFRNVRIRDLANSTTTSTLDNESSTSSSDESNGSSSSNGYSTNDTKSNSTYVAEEVAKFRALADSWWDLHGDFKPLHSMNRLRVSMIREGLVQSRIAKPEHVDGPRPLTGLKILDVGCGGGILCEPLARLGARVTGVDAAEENISVARLHADQDSRVQQNVEYINGTIEEFKQNSDDKYDAVIASEVLEHVAATNFFIQSCVDTLKPGGSFFLTTINKTTCAWLGAIAVAERVLHIVPPGTHDWNKFVPHQDLLFMLEKNGCVTRLVHGMAYNPLVNKWSWLSNTSINYAVHAVKQCDDNW